MKRIIKTLYTVISGTLLLTACQQEEDAGIVLPVNDRRIVVHTSVPDLASRAEVVTSDLEYIYITAFDESDINYKKEGTLLEYFKNEMLQKPDGSDMFLSDRCVWPLPGQESDILHFFAYYPHRPESAELVNTSVADDVTTTVGYKITNYSIEKNIADQIDFITAYTTGTMEKNQFSGINLELKHQLSRIEVMAKGTSKIYKLEIAGVRLGGVPLQGTFDFTAESWSDLKEKKVVEYIYQPGDKIVSINNSENEVSIMGGTDAVNYAMLIPSKYEEWDYSKDNSNSKEGLYISVLLRVLDKTPGGNDKQQYPYFDNSQGLNAMNIERVFLAVDNNGNVTANPGQLYKNAQGQYFTNEAMTAPYTAPAGSTVKEFGWASLPVTADWAPGYAYTYTLDYTYGMGLHGPEVTGDVSPKAGDPVISDRVGVSLGFKEWLTLTPTPVVVPGN